MIEKRCTKCKQVKPVSDFLKDARHSDGLFSRCIACLKVDKKIYYHTKPGYREHHNQKCRDWAKDNPEKKAILAKLEKLRHPEKVAARQAVGVAVFSGKLPRVKTLVCRACGGNASEYHHYLGYAKEHWLDVIPYCTLCHKKIDHPEMTF